MVGLFVTASDSPTNPRASTDGLEARDTDTVYSIRRERCPSVSLLGQLLTSAPCTHALGPFLLTSVDGLVGSAP